MGVSQAMYSGVSGLSINSDNMSVIANNIANANASGFKYDRAEFEDILSTDLGSGNGQIGRGARLATVSTVHTQGGFQVTDMLTDMAIQGTGFFVVGNPNTELQESGGLFFTRVGSFHFDKDGFLADNSNGHVKGYMSDEEGNLSSKLSDIRLMTNNLPPVKTSKMQLNVNLDARAKPPEVSFDMNSPEKTSNFNTTMNVYDSQGRSRSLTLYFERLESTEGISWKYHAAFPSEDLEDGSSEMKLTEVGSGKVHFTNDGKLKLEEPEEFSVNFSGGALPGQKIELDFGKSIEGEGGNGLGASASIATRSDTIFHNQNGYEAGNLKSLKIDLDGSIQGFYTNGLQRKLGAVAIATFENQDALKKAGRNQFYKTLDSGPPKIGQPQTGNRGSVYASTLEESNVDLANQFVKMIMTQRGFQANSRSITTTDNMLEEIVNLKR